MAPSSSKDRKQRRKEVGRKTRPSTIGAHASPSAAQPPSLPPPPLLTQEAARTLASQAVVKALNEVRRQEPSARVENTGISKTLPPPPPSSPTSLLSLPQQTDFFAELPAFRAYARRGLDAELTFARGADLDAATKEAAFELCKV